MNVLGISAFYHDSAACLVKDGVVVAAAQEERFTRKKHDSSFPENAVRFCLAQSGVLPEQLDKVVFFEKPFLKFERLLETYLSFAPRGFGSFFKAMPLWVKDKLFQKSILTELLGNILGDGVDWKDRLLFSEHHLSHAASAFYPSPFRESAVLTMDGVGEWATTSVSIGRENDLYLKKEIHFPHSLGMLYSAFTYYAGFKVNSGEYKLMGLAPYGKPRFADLIKEELIDLKSDGSFWLNMDYFDYCTGLTMTSKKFHRLFGRPPREPESELQDFHMDIAASIQAVTEEAVLNLASSISRETGQENLCLAGGVALNCVANGVLHRSGIFRNIWIQPAAGDAGGAIGAALAASHLELGVSRIERSGLDQMRGAYLGPEFQESEIMGALEALGAKFHVLEENAVLDKVVQALTEGKAIGWMCGRMEFGPRALGARSILADPRSELMQRQLNLKVKFRESFRPFAPSVLAEKVSEWFDLSDASPYMLIVANVRDSKRHSSSGHDESLFGIDKLNVPRSEIPAVTHVDYSARIQTVHAETNPRYHALIKRFFEVTGCPVLVNTSFNVRGEPIVCTPEDAFRCFMGTDLDVLVIENVILYKIEQDHALSVSYKDRYELD